MRFRYNNVTAQVDYSLNYDSRFFLPSTYYVRESYFGPNKTKIAWIHIDTNIFYYNSTDLEEAERLPLKRQLNQFGWNSIQAKEDKLRWIEDRLIEQQDSKWIFVVGK
jgi:tartrate-resistant acid phosphatase type 5